MSAIRGPSGPTKPSRIDRAFTAFLRASTTADMAPQNRTQVAMAEATAMNVTYDVTAANTSTQTVRVELLLWQLLVLVLQKDLELRVVQEARDVEA